MKKVISLLLICMSLTVFGSDSADTFKNTFSELKESKSKSILTDYFKSYGYTTVNDTTLINTEGSKVIISYNTCDKEFDCIDIYVEDMTTVNRFFDDRKELIFSDDNHERDATSKDHMSYDRELKTIKIKSI